ncbi:MAG: hypothetical protein ACP5PV_01005 [Methanothrix sp.]
MGMDKYKTGLAKKLGLDVPSSPPLKGKGTTGLMLPELKKSKDGRMILYPKLKSTWSPEFVMQYIANQANGYGEYIESVWDCEDYAFLAAADVRRRFPGQAIGILLGIGRYGGENINGKGHAINILWFSEREDDQMSWFPRYYDATTKQEITAQQFDPLLLVAVPIGCSNDKKKYRDFQPLLSPVITNGTIALDRAPYDYDAIGDIKKELNRWVETEYGMGKENENEALGELPDGFYIPSDLTFYWFAHIRNWFAHERKPRPNKKVPPVGVAFGQFKEKDLDVLIIWKSPTEYTYFHTVIGEEIDPVIRSGFKPRLVIV